MSTCATISIKTGEYYKTISCHKVLDLIDLGNISFLDKFIDCPAGHSFTHPVRGYTIAYRRDRGAGEKEKATKGLNYFFNTLHCHNNYFWDGQEWFFNDELLSDVLAEREKFI